MTIIGNEKYRRSEPGLITSTDGGAMIRYSLIFSAIAIVAAIAVPLAVENNSQFLAFDPQEIDMMTTSSIGKNKRYRVRKSILDTRQINEQP